MKKWKALIAGVIVLCLVPVTPYTLNCAEEAEEGQEAEEDPIPESYYYTIESNEVTGWPQGPAIESAAAVVMDMDTGVFTYSKNATAAMYPASTTKIMTTLLLVETCDLDDEITFSDIVYDLEEGSSHLGIQPGETMTLRDAAYGIMLASANDIANGVAEYIGGSISGFAQLMNEKASELGCVNTHFVNPHGLYSDDHYTCAYDMALIARAAYANPVFREIATATEHSIPETNLTDEVRSFQNHHKMMQSDSEYYQEWCTGGKTGYTEACLNTLVTYAEEGDTHLVSVVFRVNGAGKAYNESTEILEYTLDNFYTQTVSGGDISQTFYEIMGLQSLGLASGLQSPYWDQMPVTDYAVSLTLPNDVTVQDLNLTSMKSNGVTGFSCDYNGYSVGAAQGRFQAVDAPVQLPFEKDVEVVLQSVSGEASSGQSKALDNVNDILAQTTDIFKNVYTVLAQYTENHTLTVLIAGIIALVIVILLIILLIFRSTSESRIRRRRKQAEKERKKREEEIERMTTAEIEAELRAVMEQERLRKEQEQLAQLEAERAAEEQRIMEEKAHETERMLEELEKERQERLAAKDKGKV